MVYFAFAHLLSFERVRKNKETKHYSPANHIIFPVNYLAALKEVIFEMMQLLIHQEMENTNISKKFYLSRLFLEAYLMHVMSVHMKNESH